MTVFENDAHSAALVRLLDEVAHQGYRFITPTPLTHQRVLNNRGLVAAADLRDIFGWNLPFSPEILPLVILEAMHEANVIEQADGLSKSTVRIASLGDMLVLHSGYPTTQEDAIFFGPDTYRFIRLIDQSFEEFSPQLPVHRILDIGCGSGAGGLFSAQLLIARGWAKAADLELVMNDINSQALALTVVNAQAAGITVVPAKGDALSCVTGSFDLIISNPPYLDDSDERTYRHGGAGLGRALSVRIVTEALSRLAPGGRLVLYTGAAVVAGNDGFLADLKPMLSASGCKWSYEEIDPDIFGEELERPQYASAERIAAVGLVVVNATKKGD